MCHIWSSLAPSAPSAPLKTRAVTTYFIINLAFADLLTGIFAIPFKFQAALFQTSTRGIVIDSVVLPQEWFLPSSLCQIVPYAETVSLSVSVFTLTASAVHEFRTTFFPKRGRMNTRSARSLVLMIWVIAALVSLPHGLFHRVYLIEDGDLIIAQCRPVYADENWWKIYNVYLTIIHYFVPMIILDTAYTMIAIKIWGSTVNGGEESQSTSTQTNLNTEISNRKLMNMLMIVVACFSLCWFPLETYLLLNEIGAWENQRMEIYQCFILLFTLARNVEFLFKSCHIWANKYKREYRWVLNRLRCRVDDDMEPEQKFETEYPAGISLPPSIETTSADQEKHL
ncbi:7 transmembrane receptor [Cooperia oncophora]